ncbi:MAG: hypothetical protein E7161_05215 [Firmicutes bacterium]|nr:hypothetical protein [Bacillota bacterium]
MKKKNSKKIMENPIMVDQKKVKPLRLQKSSEELNEVKVFVIIVALIAILIGAIYGLTELLMGDEPTTNDSVVAGEINYNKVSVGTLLNRPYDNYYVIVYNSEDDKAALYSTILTKYMQKSSDKNYIKIYFCDLNNNLNSVYYDVNGDGKSNSKATKVEEFDFGDVTLIKVEKGKVKKYIENYEEIKEILK